MVFSGKRFINVVTAAAILASCTVDLIQGAGIPSNAVAEYWGQNSAASGGSGSQENLASYCDDSTDILILSFLHEFNIGDLPTLNFANACTTTFDGTKLLHCPQIAKDIKTCQSKGKKILLSLGGAAGSYGFSSDSQAKTFAQTLYDMFGAGSHKYRPFDDAVIDGFDFDIEGGGATGYATLSDSLKSLSNNKLLVTGAPQCPFPDAMLGDALDNAVFDAVFVQFYNNYCSPSGSNFNFDSWDKWASSTSKNKDVKVFLGLPGSSTAAGSGYLPFDQIKSTVASIQKYDSYGGVMFWDASQTYSNTEESPNMAVAVGKLVHDASSSSGGDESSTTTKSSAATTTAAPTSSGTEKVTTATTTATTTTDAITSSSSSKSSAASSPVPTVTDDTKTATCVKTGDSCPTNNANICAGNSFGACDNGKWVVQACPSGLTCFSTTDGTSIYCAQPNSGASSSRDTCNAKSGSETLASQKAPKPYKNNRVQAQLSVTSATSNSWSAVINARRTDLKPFGSRVVVALNLSPSMKLTSVENGKIKKSGNKVTMQIKNPHKKSMDLVFTIKGSIAKDGVFVAPSASSMTFRS
ncbi:unnamed protein product [Absidia cylindrospora]